ncbi:MAG: DUF934 domain-containing protein [Planktomarina sp.]
MSVIVTDTGFTTDHLDLGFTTIDDAQDGQPIDLPSDCDPMSLHNQVLTAPAIRIDFPTSHDGRGFTIAAQLRRMGYKGRLRARGQVLADQYAMARRSGFDEVEISNDLATRQPEDQWLARANWQAHSYQNRLRA